MRSSPLPASDTRHPFEASILARRRAWLLPKLSTSLGLHTLAWGVGAPLGAFVLQWMFWSRLQPFVWFMFYPAVLLASRMAGRGGAIVSGALSVYLVWRFFITVQPDWVLAPANYYFATALFLFMVAFLGELNEQLLRVVQADRSEYRAREGELAAIVDSTDDAIMSAHLDGRIRTWNRGAERMYGIPANEAIGNTLSRNFPSAQRKQVLELLERVGQGESVTGLESRRTHRDGHLFDIAASVAPIRNGDNVVVAVSMIARDITGIKRGDEFRRQVETRFESLFNAMEEGFFLAETVVNADGHPTDWRYLDVNAAYARILGSTREAITGRSGFEVSPEMTADWFATCTQVALTGKSVRAERFDPRSGCHYAIKCYSAQRNQFACILVDITDRKLAEEALSASEARYARVMEGADQGFWEWDLLQRRIAVNPRFAAIVGYAHSECPTDPKQLFAHLDRNELPQLQSAVVQNLRRVSAFLENEMRCRTTAGEWIWIRVRGKVILRDGDGRATLMAGTLTDVTQRKQSEAVIWQQANYDALTHLPNRSMLRDRLNQELKKCHHDGSRLATLFIDLDHFKEVNDTLGHGKGDLLLVEAARRIKSCVRDSDTVSRQGGDEFTVIMPHASNLQRVEQVAQGLLAALSRGVDLEGELAFVSASIGIALYPDDATDSEGLGKCADQALYAAKDAGRNRFSFFTPLMQETAQNRMHLTKDLRNAPAGGQLRLVYQPIVDLRDGCVRKAEALIRWQHPQRGMISPAEFIPLAESSGLIVDIGDWVFRQAAQQARAWRQLHHPDFQISVNKSPVQFANGVELQQAWFAHLREMGLPGQAIAIEITEGLLLAPRADIVTQLSELREAGLGVSLDDFGTGYSSLSYLQKFDIDFVKIDQSFVRNLSPVSKNLALCKAIILMAHELGMSVIAEGVETAQQRDLLTAAGCDYAQGYLYSRPVGPGDFDLWLARGAPTQDVGAG